MSSFFTAPASQRKRKRGDERSSKPSKRRGVEQYEGKRSRDTERSREIIPTERDDSISGSESEDQIEPETGSESEATSEEGETPAERRVRLAQRYLENIRQEVDEAGFDAEDIDNDLIAERLKKDVDEQKGRQFRLIARTLDYNSAEGVKFRADTQSTTTVAVRQPYAYTVSKDKTLIKWQLVSPSSVVQTNGDTNGKSTATRRRPKQLAYVRGIKVNASSPQQHGHTGAILSLAVSPDGKFVATGGMDKRLIIWDSSELRPLKTFHTHRDAVTSLDFAPTTSQSGFGAQLFSASMDRSLKTYSLAGEESLAYVETLFGHQDHVLAVSAMAMDQCVSVGARDRSARLWRVSDETQLKFLGDSSKREEYHTGSLDCVAALPPQHFVTGSDSGAISLWSIHKKKALFTIQTAHGVDKPPPIEEVTSEGDPKIVEERKKTDNRKAIPRPITALVALTGTDIVLSGSWDGWIRVWKVSDDKRTLENLGVIGHSTQPETQTTSLESQAHDDGKEANDDDNTVMKEKILPPPPPPVKGIINSLAVFERRKEIPSEFGGKKEGETLGLCVVAGTGKEMKFGRWKKIPDGKNGAIVFEIPLLRGYISD